MRNKKGAFTLVELIVVITIIAILGTIAFVALQGYGKNARDSVRITDVSNMKKSLELWALRSGTYPIPTNGVPITYSGTTVWTQGTFGDSVLTAVGKLNKKPVDPIYNIEYTYSVSEGRQEFQLGTVLEHDTFASFIPQAHADHLVVAYLVGTYNSVLTTLNSGGAMILALPSIMLSETTEKELKNISPSNIVYRGKTNLPSAYTTAGITAGQSDFSFTPTVVWSGSSITELNNQSEFQTFVSNLQNVYKNNSVLSNLPEYKIIVGESDQSLAVMQFTKSLIEGNSSKVLTNVTIVSESVSAGVCGSANSIGYADASSLTGASLCTTGTASSVSGTGPWTWTCSADSVANCSANLVTCNENETVQNSACKDPYWDNVTLLLSANDTLNSDKGVNPTVNGNTIIQSESSQFGGGSAYFDGNGDYLYYDSSTDYDIFNTDMTIETWLYPTADAGRSSHLASFVVDDSNRVSLYFNGTSFTFWSSTSGAGGGQRIATTEYTLNSWNHIALVKNGGTFTLYVNGNSKGSTTTSVYPTGNQYLKIGTYSPTYPLDFLVGYLHDFRVTKGVARYTSNFTPPGFSFPAQ